MGLLTTKGWRAQEFYNEYLTLKYNITNMLTRQRYVKHDGYKAEHQEIQVKIDQHVERLHFVLNQLETVHGLNMTDLVLLGVGIDIWNTPASTHSM